MLVCEEFTRDKGGKSYLPLSRYMLAHMNKLLSNTIFLYDTVIPKVWYMTHWRGAGQEGPKLWSEAWKRTQKNEAVRNERYQWKSENQMEMEEKQLHQGSRQLPEQSNWENDAKGSFKVGLSCQNMWGKRAWHLLTLYLDLCYRFQELPPLLKSVECFLNSS